MRAYDKKSLVDLIHNTFNMLSLKKRLEMRKQANKVSLRNLKRCASEIREYNSGRANPSIINFPTQINQEGET